MFTAEELKNIDRAYFHIIDAGCYCVTLQSKNTDHYWQSYTSSTRHLFPARYSISTGRLRPVMILHLLYMIFAIGNFKREMKFPYL